MKDCKMQRNLLAITARLIQTKTETNTKQPLESIVALISHITVEGLSCHWAAALRHTNTHKDVSKIRFG